MCKYSALIAMIVFSATSALAELELFPAGYDVTGVASDDVLNVRSVMRVATQQFGHPTAASFYMRAT